MKAALEQAPLIKARHNIRFRDPFSRQVEAEEPPSQYSVFSATSATLTVLSSGQISRMFSA